jgi:hypothetical protein
MRAQGDPGRWLTRDFNASADVSYEDIKGFGRLLINAAGGILRMPDPVSSLCDDGWGLTSKSHQRFGFCNNECGLSGGKSTVVIPSGQTMHYEYYRGATGTFQCDVDLVSPGAVAQTHTSDLTWTTADPTLASVALDTNPMYWQLENGICWFETSISWDDGNAATNLTATIPLEAPCLLSCDIPIMGYLTVDGVETEILAYIGNLRQ